MVGSVTWVSNFTSRALDSLGKFNARHPWSHNDFYTAKVVREARHTRAEGGRSALDIGAGTGNLALKLSRVFDHVVALEPDAATAAIARTQLGLVPGVELWQRSFSAFEGETFDFISMVAVLHHLPLHEALQTVRRLVNPGGRLVIVGLTSSVLPLDVASLLLNPLFGIAKHPRSAGAQPANMTAPTAAPVQSLGEIAAAMRTELGQVRLRTGLFWRYTAVWKRPIEK